MNKVLAWVKSNWLIVVLSAVVVASLPAGILVSNSLAGNVVKDVQERASKDFNDVSKEKVTFTLPSPVAPGKSLVEFPDALNRGAIEWFAAERARLTAETERVWNTAVAFNRDDHKALLEGLFPAPDRIDELARRTEFGNLLVTVPARLLRRMGAGAPPDPARVAERIRDLFEQTVLRQQQSGAPDDPQARRKMMDDLIAERQRAYAQQAADIKVYADAAAFANLPPRPPNPPPTLKQCWEYQEAVWVYEDLARAIALANSAGDVDASAGTGGVASSVVKRILAMTVDPGPTIGGGSSESGGSAAASRSDGITGLLATDPNVSITGRVSGPASGNQLYDLKTVRLDMIVSTTRVPVLLDALARTNFLTVIGCELTGSMPGSTEFDVHKDFEAGYWYGPEHTSRAVVVVEAVLLRDWTKDLMPPDVRAERGVAEPAAKAGAPAPSAANPSAPPPAPATDRPPPERPESPRSGRPRRGEEDLPG